MRWMADTIPAVLGEVAEESDLDECKEMVDSMAGWVKECQGTLT